MKKLFAGLVCLLTVLAINVPSSNAFPWIFTRFRAQYLQPAAAGQDDPFKDQVREAACYTCHDPSHPRDEEGWEHFHNAYGQALADALGDPEALEERFKSRSERDQVFADIDAALEEVAQQPSGDDDGRTFGERIEAGELPVALPADSGAE